MAHKDGLKGIKEGAFSRGLALARVSVSVGAKAASHMMGNLFASESEKPERIRELLMGQLDLLTQELGQLKGSLMKVGQLLSMYGEHFLPPEANALLKSLQNQAPPLQWKAIHAVLKRQYEPEVLAQLEINPEPLASASLGQVHPAIRKSDGRKLALKIQYPGVDKAIDSDLKALQTLLSVSKLVPRGPKYDELFKEVRAMLHQEVDYTRELELTREFREVLAADPRYIIPEPFPEFSTKRILATSLEEGVAIDHAEIVNLSQERRNKIGLAALELYFRELFELGAVQTDPHFGNYLIRLDPEGVNDRLVLLDFGAVRKFSKPFLNSYLEVVRGTFTRTPSRVIQGATELGFLKEGDSEEMKTLFLELSDLVMEPFFAPGTSSGVPRHLYDSEGAYLSGESDLPKRVAKKAADLAFAFRLRPPPREIVFLDRKMGGIFIFLSVLKVRIQGAKAIQRYI